MKQALQRCVAPGSFLVHDGWLSTEAAVKELGFQSAPGANHSKGFREFVPGQRSGFHSNDVESEFACWKRWNRNRYSVLRTRSMETSGDLWEYMIYRNVPGATFVQWMEMANAGALASP